MVDIWSLARQQQQEEVRQKTQQRKEQQGIAFTTLIGIFQNMHSELLRLNNFRTDKRRARRRLEKGWEG